MAVAFADLWWAQNASKLSGLANLTVLGLSAEEGATLAALAGKTMRLQCTIQDGTVWLADGEGNHEFAPQVLQRAIGALTAAARPTGRSSGRAGDSPSAPD